MKHAATCADLSWTVWEMEDDMLCPGGCERARHGETCRLLAVPARCRQRRGWRACRAERTGRNVCVCVRVWCNSHDSDVAYSDPPVHARHISRPRVVHGGRACGARAFTAGRNAPYLQASTRRSGGPRRPSLRAQFAHAPFSSLVPLQTPPTGRNIANTNLRAGRTR